MIGPRLAAFPGLSSVLRNGAALMGARWTEVLLRGIYVLVIARLLGPEAYGSWSYATASYGLFLSLSFMGLDGLLPAWLGRELQRGRRRRLVVSALALRLGLISASALALLLYAIWVEPEPSLKTLLVLMLPALVGRGLVLWTRVVLTGLERSGIGFMLAAVWRGLEFGIGIALLFAGHGIEALLILHAVINFAEGLCNLFVFHTKILPLRCRAKRRQIASLVRNGIPVGIESALAGALQALPLIVLRHLGDDLAVVGQLGLALQIAGLGALAVQSFVGAALPALSRAMAREDARTAHYGLLTAGATGAIFLLAALPAFAFGEPVLAWIFGQDFAPVGALLGPCFLMAGAMSMPQGSLHVLILRERRWAGPLASAVGLLAMLATILPAGMAAGALGIIAAAGFGFALRAILFIFAAERAMRP